MGVASLVLVRGSGEYLLSEAQAGRLITLLTDQALFKWGHRVGTSEQGSWTNSLPALLNVLVDAGLGQVEVLIEYGLPHSPKRVDAVLCGVHPSTGAPSYVLVELKQWSTVEKVTEDLVEMPGRKKKMLHPVEQVRRYCEYLVDSTPALADRPEVVRGIAFLHNARSRAVAALDQYEPTAFGCLFTLDDRGQMVNHLTALLDTEGSREHALQAADDFLQFEHAPTKPLLDLAAKEIQEREQFVLLDEQWIAYKLVMQAVARSRAGNTRTAVIVSGGPGSGKSVIALSLLGELARQGRRVHHATGSSAFTKTMRKIAGRRNPRVQTLFKYFNNYMGSAPRELDVLICDEAHRIRETSANRFTSAELRSKGRKQISELLDVASVPVFLLDENQTVRPGEMGSLEEITAAAEAAGCEVDIVSLDGQFRCGGSDLFDTWVERLLGLDPLQPVSWQELTADSDDQFRVASAVSPPALEAWLTNQSESHGGTARIAAGYCWPWSDPETIGDGKHLVDDVQIGDWRRPWNAKPEKRVPDAPESYYWASDDRGFAQIGCIYTAQGFEYDWAGVIFGRDFVRRGDRWVARRGQSHDPAVRKASDENFEELVRNTYKVLVTRGMRGVCVYSTDPETQAFLEKMTT
ncbi:DNA/RNA helicase domain-containing protein [Nocardia sp. NPDC051981]|uniref:DNA/RNA helicase domain-containing protein n=1 Tax=Nocardia sp. NPDC051981 TaxID=3155417 RepID=UPI00341692E4